MTIIPSQQENKFKGIIMQESDRIQRYVEMITVLAELLEHACALK